MGKFKTKEFTSEFLFDTVIHSDLVVEEGSDGASKWGTYKWIVFKDGDTFYRWNYEVIPQEGIQIHEDMIECTEVRPVSKTVTSYESVTE